jgi:hypothetical protein
MPLHSWAQLFLLCGGFLLIISGVFFFVPFMIQKPWGFTWPVVDLLNPRSKDRKQMLTDLRDPNIAMGGLLGLMIMGFVCGFGLAAVGGILWVVSRIAG